MQPMIAPAEAPVTALPALSCWMCRYASIMLKVGPLRIARGQSGSMVRHRRRSLPISRRKLVALMGVAVLGGATVCVLFSPRAARAQAAPSAGFPSKMLRIIVPFTPGGANDVVAREIAAGLQASLKETVVVENKPGGGTIAYAYVAKLP